MHVDGAFGIREQALQLDHGFARQDDFLLGHFHIQRGRGKSQAVAVGGDQAELLAFGDKQNAVQVVAYVVHRHGKRDLAQQAFKGFLRHAKHRAKAGRLLHQRKIFGGQGLQGELAFAALEDDFALARFQGHGLVGGHGAQDVDELARAYGGAEIAGIAAEFGAGADLDFQVAGGELQAGAGFAYQHVGKDRQSVATFDDTGHRLQYGQHLVLRGFQNNHVRLQISIYLPAGRRERTAPAIFAVYWAVFRREKHFYLSPSAFVPKRAIVGSIRSPAVAPG